MGSCQTKEAMASALYRKLQQPLLKHHFLNYIARHRGRGAARCCCVTTRHSMTSANTPLMLLSKKHLTGASLNTSSACRRSVFGSNRRSIEGLLTPHTRLYSFSVDKEEDNLKFSQQINTFFDKAASMLEATLVDNFK